MATIRESIIANIRTALTGTTGVSTRIYRSRVEPISRGESPAIVVEPISDQASTDVSFCKTDWSLTVRIAVIVRGIIPDQQADTIIESLHTKVMADQTLGGYAMSIEARGVQFDMIEADQPAGVIACDYLIRYRTAVANLAVN
jgi:hypothetical protein